MPLPCLTADGQIQFALQLVKPILDGQAKSFEIKADETDKYNTWLQDRLSTSVWTACNSYYQAGRQSKSKIIATFPGPVALFWWLTRYPQWEKFHAVGAEAWERQRRINKAKKWASLIVLLVLALWLGPLLNGPALKQRLPGVVTKLKDIFLNFSSTLA